MGPKAAARSCTVVVLSIPVMALLLMGAPWWSACDATSAEDALGDPASAAYAGQEFAADAEQESASDASDILGIATLDEIEPMLAELSEPGALAEPRGGDAPACVQGFQELTRQCVLETRDIAMPCAQQIVQLFQDGEPQAAHEAAAECRMEINDHTAACVDELQAACQTCIAELMEQGAPPAVIQGVLGACRRGAEIMLHARRAGIGAIDHALDVGTAFTCVQTVHEIAVGCAQQNGQTANQCVQQIEELIADGHDDQAHEAGQACIQTIIQHGVQCTGNIQQHCSNCLQQLVHNCANAALIQNVHQACENNAGLVIGSAQNAIAAIQNALPEDLP